MTTIRQRLVLCFANVFPNLPEHSFPDASLATLPDWDSVAQVTLLSAISEEFGIEMEMSDFESLNSYVRIVAFLENKLA